MSEIKFTRRVATAKSLDVAAYAADISERRNAVESERGAVMFDAALLTHNVMTRDHIGKGRLYTSQGAFFGPGETNDDGTVAVPGLGYAKSYGTLLKRLARAAVVHGIDRDSEVWTLLADGSKYPAARVDGILSADKGKQAKDPVTGTTGTVTRLLDLVVAEAKAGKVQRTAGTPHTPDGGEGDEGGEDTTPATPATVSEMLTETIGQVLARLDSLVQTMTADEFSPVEDRLTAIISAKIEALRVASAA